MSATEDKPRTYGEDEIPAKLSEYGLDEWYYEDKWIRRKYNTDGWPTTLMAVNAVGYLCAAPGRHVGQVVGQAGHALGRRDHRQGLHAGAEDRGHDPVAA